MCLHDMALAAGHGRQYYWQFWLLTVMANCHSLSWAPINLCLVYFWWYYLANYEYIILSTIWNLSRIFGTILVLICHSRLALEDKHVLWRRYFRLQCLLWHCWLGGRKGIRPVKNWAVGCWCGCLSGARCRLAYGPADATATHCLLLQ